MSLTGLDSQELGKAYQAVEAQEGAWLVIATDVVLEALEPLDEALT